MCSLVAKLHGTEEAQQLDLDVRPALTHKLDQHRKHAKAPVEALKELLTPMRRKDMLGAIEGRLGASGGRRSIGRAGCRSRQAAVPPLLAQPRRRMHPRLSQLLLAPRRRAARHREAFCYQM